MSTVFYRWGAGRDESRVTFDGTHISVFDLKREIILSNKMGNGKDFDIGLFDNVTGEEFKDDNHQIPRSSSLIARRLPSSIKGRGNAQNYIAGTAAAEALTGDHRIEAHAKDEMRARMLRGAQGRGGTYGSLSKRFDGKEEKKEPAVAITTGNAEEDARIQAMFAQSADQWEQTQEDMSLASSRIATNYRSKPGRPSAAPGAGPSKFDFSLPPDKDPPVGYICYRCGQKGHWIQNCPTNDDPSTHDRKRFVRVTGIPRSFLKTVETPTTGEGSSGGAMLTADGGFVRAVPDQRQWQKQVAAKPRTLTGAEVRSQQPLDADLSCPICKKLVWEAVRVPCCDTAFCEECITNHLLEHDFECPACESRVASLDKLRADEGLRERVRGYVDEEIERSRREEDEERERDKDKEKAEGEEGEDKGEENGETTTEQADGDQSSAATGGKPTAPALDPAKMQEMLNPQTMQLYLAQVHKMLQNPQLTAQARVLLQTQMQMVQATVMQMQFMAASGMMANGLNGANGNGTNQANGANSGGGNGNGINGGVDGMMMNGGLNMGMGMSGMNPMGGMNGMGQGMGMGNMTNMGGMGMGMNGTGVIGNQMGNQMGMPGPNRGRGFNRGMGYQRGRGNFGRGAMMGGAGAGGVRPIKRGPDEAGLDIGGGEKQARVA